MGRLRFDQRFDFRIGPRHHKGKRSIAAADKARRGDLKPNASTLPVLHRRVESMTVLAFCDGVERGPPRPLCVDRNEGIELKPDQSVSGDAQRCTRCGIRVEELAGVHIDREKEIRDAVDCGRDRASAGTRTATALALGARRSDREAKSIEKRSQRPCDGARVGASQLAGGLRPGCEESHYPPLVGTQSIKNGARGFSAHQRIGNKGAEATQRFCFGA